MKQEDKNLLLKDLCARLPYGVKCHFKYGSAEGDITLDCIDNNVARFDYGWYGKFHVSIDTDYIKPYLRPMSSMTEEEEIEYDATFATIKISDGHYDSVMTYKSIDFLNAYHFDYRGLIPIGLAIEVTEENNPYKK